MLHMLRLPSSCLNFIKCFNLECTCGANKKAILFSCNNCSTSSFEKDKETPKCSSTSALPVLLEILRFPCFATVTPAPAMTKAAVVRSEEHTSELQSRGHLVCRLLLAK